MCSDLYITDTTLETSIQIEYPFLEHVKTMKDEMLKVVKPYRSSQEELPIIFNELLLFQEDKAVFIKESFNWGKS